MRMQFKGPAVWLDLETALEILLGKWKYPMMLEIVVEREGADESPQPHISLRMENRNEHILAMELTRHFGQGRPAKEAVIYDFEEAAPDEPEKQQEP